MGRVQESARSGAEGVADSRRERERTAGRLIHALAKNLSAGTLCGLLAVLGALALSEPAQGQTERKLVGNINITPDVERDISLLGDVGLLVWLALPGDRVGASAETLGRLTRLGRVWFGRVETAKTDHRAAPR